MHPHCSSCQLSPIMRPMIRRISTASKKLARLVHTIEVRNRRGPSLIEILPPPAGLSSANSVVRLLHGLELLRGLLQIPPIHDAPSSPAPRRAWDRLSARELRVAEDRRGLGCCWIMRRPS